MIAYKSSLPLNFSLAHLCHYSTCFGPSKSPKLWVWQPAIHGQEGEELSWLSINFSLN